MTVLIILIGGLILCAGIVLLINPELIFGFLRRNIENPVIHIIAVVVRLFIGALLIVQSRFSKFQLEVEISGWVLIVGGVLLAVIGKRKFRKIMAGTLNRSKLYGRFSGILSMMLGGLLIYVFYI